jgi:hypothetical protein
MKYKWKLIKKKKDEKLTLFRAVFYLLKYHFIKYVVAKFRSEPGLAPLRSTSKSQILYCIIVFITSYNILIYKKAYSEA